MKLCTRCEVELPQSSFYYNKKTKDGLSFWCKECHRISRKEARQTSDTPKPQVLKHRLQPSNAQPVPTTEKDEVVPEKGEEVYEWDDLISSEEAAYVDPIWGGLLDDVGGEEEEIEDKKPTPRRKSKK